MKYNLCIAVLLLGFLALGCSGQVTKSDFDFSDDDFGFETDGPTEPTVGQTTRRTTSRTTSRTTIRTTSKPTPATARTTPRTTPSPSGNFQTPSIGIRISEETDEHLKYNNTITPCQGVSYGSKCYHGGQCVRDNGINRCVCDKYFVGESCNTKAQARPADQPAETPTTMREKFYQSKSNPDGVGNTIGRWFALSSLDCMNKCRALAGCNSINYGLVGTAGLCELLDITAGPNTFLREDNGWIKPRPGWVYTCCVKRLVYRGIGSG